MSTSGKKGDKSNAGAPGRLSCEGLRPSAPPISTATDRTCNGFAPISRELNARKSSGGFNCGYRAQNLVIKVRGNMEMEPPVSIAAYEEETPGRAFSI